MLKGHPPGCFHPVSGQNAGLVSRLDWQEWTIFTFINPSANTLVEKENGGAAREPASLGFLEDLRLSAAVKGQRVRPKP